MSEDSQGIYSYSRSEMAHQIRRDKLRVQGFEGIEIVEEEGIGAPQSSYEANNMLSEMFNFPSTATELLENQILHSYRNSRASELFLQQRQGMALGGESNLGISKEEQISSINSDSAAAMQLFLINPPQQDHRSPPSHPSPSGEGHFGHFTWIPNRNNPNDMPAGIVEPQAQGQGLSLSLSSSLTHLDPAAAKAEQLRIGDGGMWFFGGGEGSTPPQYQFKNLGTGGGHHQSGIGSMNLLRSSKYIKPAQELLEEFCSVGRNYHQSKKDKFRNPNSNPSGGGGGPSAAGITGNSSSTKDLPPLSSADRLEHQRRKVKLLSMLDEVDRRYSHYCEQMQVVVNSFDMVMGLGASVPYTCLAQKAMSRHFRCLKEAILTQLKHSCGLLGENDVVGSSGITKGETPRLKLVEQSLRQQRAFHNQIGMGMTEQEAWRPQRGLPERSVNILRAWLFEHFLHPYPSDADKHLLARQAALSRNQVSNWFINARVRLWKPMIEEMYQQEAENAAEDGDGHLHHRDQTTAVAPVPIPATTYAATAATLPKINASDVNDQSFAAINNQQCFSDTRISAAQPLPSAVPDMGSMIRFGTSSGDVSLTLGLRHAGNLPEKGTFSVREFGGC